MFGSRNFLLAKGGAAIGNLFSWGSGTSGQLGLGNSTSYSSPVNVGTLKTWAISASSNGGSLAIKTDGTLWTWGNGNSGANGQGSTASRSSPVQVGSLTNWSKPTRGGQNSGRGSVLCVKTDGTLWAWGSNIYFGQLGLGDTINRSSPTQVGALTTWANISTGQFGTLGVTTSGALWGWGYGRAVANNEFTSPVQIGSLTNWSKSQVFIDHSLNVKTDNTLWVMGNNSSGQLGNGLGPSGYAASPIQIGSSVWATPIVGGNINNFSACVRTDGTLWTWGRNTLGQLGLGNTTNYSSPKQVGSLTNWAKIAGGENLVVATKTDGTLWTWGKNNLGQLGLGDTTDRSSPVQVGALTNWSIPVAGYSFSMAITT